MSKWGLDRYNATVTALKKEVSLMDKGEHYVCGCGAEVEVLAPCTCEQKQSQLTCTCGQPMRMKAKTGATA
jgi:hypothetical protein